MPAPILPAEAAAYSMLKRAIASIRMNLGRHLQQLGDLSLVQFEILFFLEQADEGLRMHEIADAVGISRSGLTYQVGQLEQAGWVQRVSAPENSRAVIAELTPAGREHVAGLQELHFDFVHKHAFGALSGEELELLVSTFQRIADGAAGLGVEPESAGEAGAGRDGAGADSGAQ